MLMSTGVGLRFRTTQYLMGFVDVGFGLFEREYLERVAQPTARIHFGIRNDWVPQGAHPRHTTGTTQDPHTPHQWFHHQHIHEPRHL
jgi:hypothetical protein